MLMPDQEEAFDEFATAMTKLIRDYYARRDACDACVVRSLLATALEMALDLGHMDVVVAELERFRARRGQTEH